MKRVFKIMLFRMWAAGAVCFFAAWGRSGSQEAGAAFSLNLIAGLIVIMVIGDVLIVNPVIRLIGGKRAFSYREEQKNSMPLFLGVLLHIFKVTVIMLLIVQSYYLLNVLFIYIFNMDETSVPVPLEPILFGILYGLYYLVFDIAGNVIRSKIWKTNLLKI